MHACMYDYVSGEVAMWWYTRQFVDSKMLMAHPRSICPGNPGNLIGKQLPAAGLAKWIGLCQSILQLNSLEGIMAWMETNL